MGSNGPIWRVPEPQIWLVVAETGVQMTQNGVISGSRPPDPEVRNGPIWLLDVKSGVKWTYFEGPDL